MYQVNIGPFFLYFLLLPPSSITSLIHLTSQYNLYFYYNQRHTHTHMHIYHLPQIFLFLAAFSEYKN